MRRSPQDEGLRWLKQAQADFKAGDYLRAGEQFNLACFVFQQAAEKALKAFLYAQGEDRVVGHSVQKLCQDCAGYDRTFDDLGQEVNGLDGYYIPTRYPNGLPDGTPADVYTQAEAQHTREMCRKVLALVGRYFQP